MYVCLLVSVFAYVCVTPSNASILLFSGVIDFLVSNHPIAKILREHLVFKIIPCLNPDGVYLGNYRYGHLIMVQSLHIHQHMLKFKQRFGQIYLFVIHA